MYGTFHIMYGTLNLFIQTFDLEACISRLSIDPKNALPRPFLSVLRIIMCWFCKGFVPLCSEGLRFCYQNLLDLIYFTQLVVPMNFMLFNCFAAIVDLGPRP